MTLALSETCE